MHIRSVVFHPCIIRALSPASRRHLHLIHELFTKTPTDKLIGLPRKKLPDVTNKKFQLLDHQTRKTAVITLSDAVKLIQPLTYLCNISRIPDGPLYTIRPLKVIKLPPKSKAPKFKWAGRAKEIHLTTVTPRDHLEHILSIAYDFLLKGQRVAFHLKPRSSTKTKTVDWALQNCMQLRPECMLASMPKGTTVLAEPIIDGTQIVWAVECKELIPQDQGWRGGTLKVPNFAGTALKSYQDTIAEKIRAQGGNTTLRSCPPEDTDKGTKRSEQGRKEEKNRRMIKEKKQRSGRANKGQEKGATQDTQENVPKDCPELVQKDSDRIINRHYPGSAKEKLCNYMQAGGTFSSKTQEQVSLFLSSSRPWPHPSERFIWKFLEPNGAKHIQVDRKINHPTKRILKDRVSLDLPQRRILDNQTSGSKAIAAAEDGVGVAHDANMKSGLVKRVPFGEKKLDQTHIKAVPGQLIEWTYINPHEA